MTTQNERLQVNVRLERELIDELDEMARDESLDRAELARRLLREGLRRERTELAIRRYRAREISLGRAAEVAKVSLYEIIDRIHDDGVPYDLDPLELERLTHPRPDPRPLVAARETPARYGAQPDAASGIDELRADFRPTQVRWLFVGESSPAGGTHFYRANSNLFRATREAFAQVFGTAVPDGPAFLHWFRDQGGWLVDLVERPVNHDSDAARANEVTAGIPRLAATIKVVHPAMLVVVKATIAEAVAEAARSAGYEGPVIRLPFPVRQWQKAYVRELAAALRTDRP